MVAFLEIGANLGWPLFGPPEIPADRASAIRDAFARVVESPEFAAAIFDSMKAQVNPTLADELNGYVNRSLDTPQSIVAEAKEILGLN
jgi:tripartite-type tricarboxylate transporter receptor subunit TctC